MSKVFKKGQMVKHPNVDEPIRVKFSDENITVVERINESKYPSKHPERLGKMIYPVYILKTDKIILWKGKPTEATEKALAERKKSLQKLSASACPS